MNLPPSASAGIPGLPITLPPVEGIQNEGGIAVSNARFILRDTVNGSGRLSASRPTAVSSSPGP
jgi:hypothetical protein